MLRIVFLQAISTLSCFFFFSQNGIFAQTAPLVSLWGFVHDAETKAPLPFTNIRILGTARGTISNEEGKYEFILPPATYRVVFSYIGYRSDTLNVCLNEKSTRQDLWLEPTVLPLQSVTVLSDEYNPAAKIVKEAIAKKRKILSQLHHFEFEAYTKSIFYVPTKKKTTPDTLIGGICEVQSLGYFQAPDKYQEIITARRQSANLTPAMNIFTLGKIPNLNDDVIILERNLIVGPTAPHAFDYYDYEMVDTTAIDNLMVFRIKITPQSQVVPLFDGIISIADSTFSVMEVDVRGNKALDMPMISDLHFQEKFALYDNRFWLPIEVRGFFKIEYLSAPVIHIEQISLLDNYQINQSLPDNIFDQFQLRVSPTADRFDSAKWAFQQRLPLTTQEIVAYHRLDSLMSRANLLEKGLLFVIRSPFSLPSLPVTTLADFYHFNRVEGNYFGLGLATKNLLPLTRGAVTAGFGFSDKKWKYTISAEQFFSTNKKFSIGLSLFKRVAYREPESIYSLNTVTALCLFDKTDYYDYYLAQGWNAAARWLPHSGWQFELKYQNEAQRNLVKTSNFSLFYRSRKYRPNPVIDEGDKRSLYFSLTFDNRQFIDFGVFQVPAGLQKSWLLKSIVEISDKTFLKSDFNFARFYFHARRYQPTFATGYLAVDFLCGWSRGDLPRQNLFDLPSSIADYSTFGVFRSAGNKEFAGEKISALLIEHDFGRLPFHALGLPLFKKLTLDFILTGGAGWTALSSKKQIDPLPGQPIGDVFYEAGLALGRVFSFMRLDFSWRLTHQGIRDFVCTIASSLN